MIVVVVFVIVIVADDLEFWLFLLFCIAFVL